MSKAPWQLPTQKGTEIFPETTRVPVKVVISVAPGSDVDEAHRTYEQHQGSINKFYLKATQAHAAGTTDISAMHAELPGAKMSYINQQGLEYVHIVVAGGKEQSESSSEEKKTAWDFVLVDIEAPVWSTGYAIKPTSRASSLRTGAVVVKPVDPDLEGPQVAIDVQFFDSTVQQSAGDEPMLQFGGAARAEQIGSTIEHTEDTQISSLLIDIRKYHEYPVIEVDLYARLAPIGIGKEIRAIIVRAVNGGTPEARCYYTGGSGTLTFINAHYPINSAGITVNDTSNTTEINSFIPYPYTRATVPDEVLRDAGEFSPAAATTVLRSPGAEWINNNADVVNHHMWGATNFGQWTDITSPFSWAGGSWSGGDSMTAWEADMDSISGPAAGAEEPMPFNMPGLGAITQKGEKFWYYNKASEPWFADYGGAGVLIGAPPNVTGVPNTGSAYAEIFGWGQVYNTYCYVPHISTPPTETHADITIKIAMFKGFKFDNPPAVWKWSKQRVSNISDLLQTIGSPELHFGQWEIDTKFPDRFQLGPLVPNETLPTLTITNESVPGNPANGQYLGRLIIFQEQGAFAFKPAP